MLGNYRTAAKNLSRTSDLSKASGSGKVETASDLVVGPAPHEIVTRLKADPYSKLKNTGSGVDFPSDSESHPAHQGFSVMSNATAGQLKSAVALNQGNAAGMNAAALRPNANQGIQQVPVMHTDSLAGDVFGGAVNIITGGATVAFQEAWEEGGAAGEAWLIGNIDDDYLQLPSGQGPPIDSTRFTENTQSQGRVDQWWLMYKPGNIESDVVGRADKEITPNKMAAANITRVQTGYTPGKMATANSVGVGILQNYTPAAMEAANKAGFNSHDWPVVH